MANYVVIRYNDVSPDKNSDKNTAYGICACSLSNGVLEIQCCVNDISDDLTWLKSLSTRLNDNDVDPIHLENIVEDELYAIR